MIFNAQKIHTITHMQQYWYIQANYLNQINPSYLPEEKALLPNHILTPLRPHPNLMQLSSRYINPCPGPESHLRFIVFRIADYKLASADEVRCYVAVSVWWVVCIADITSISTFTEK